MKLDNGFDVPVSVEKAWPILLDLERIAPCLPGAVIDSADGDEYSGRLRIKAGPITVSYVGTARMTSIDEGGRTVVMQAEGKEPRGSGTVKATITAHIGAAGSGSHVDVETELAITGKPAQLGRGLIAEVGGKIIDQFAGNLAKQLTDGGPANPSARHSAPEGAAPATEPSARPPAGATPPAETSLDMLEILKPQLLRAGIGLGVLVLVVFLLRTLGSRAREGRR